MLLPLCVMEDQAEGPTRRCCMKLLLAGFLVLIPFTVHAEYIGNLGAN